jgi:hypothetical protein
MGQKYYGLLIKSHYNTLCWSWGGYRGRYPIFDDILMETCAKEFATKVKKRFELDRRSGKKVCEVPFIGGKYRADSADDHAELQQRVVDALMAKQRFAWTGPDWADELPLSHEAITAAEESEDPGQRSVGLYARSLARLNWDYRTHPSFKAFARGLMAHPGTPKELRQDRRLRKEFPPARLDGLEGDYLYWRTEREIIEDRQLQDWLQQMPKVEGLPEPEPEGAWHRAGHC